MPDYFLDLRGVLRLNIFNKCDEMFSDLNPEKMPQNIILVVHIIVDALMYSLLMMYDKSKNDEEKELIGKIIKELNDGLEKIFTIKGFFNANV